MVKILSYYHQIENYFIDKRGSVTIDHLFVQALPDVPRAQSSFHETAATLHIDRLELDSSKIMHH